MTNEDKLRMLMEKIYERQKEKVISVLTKCGLLIEADTKKNFKAWTQYGTGTTAATIVSIVTEDQEAGIIVCKVGSPSKVFLFREMGTGPHKTSTGSDEFVESVTKWGQRQGMEDEEIEAVIYHIRKHGTQPRPALYPAFYQNKDKVLSLLRKEFASGN